MHVRWKHLTATQRCQKWSSEVRQPMDNRVDYLGTGTNTAAGADTSTGTDTDACAGTGAGNSTESDTVGLRGGFAESNRSTRPHQEGVASSSQPKQSSGSSIDGMEDMDHADDNVEHVEESDRSSPDMLGEQKKERRDKINWKDRERYDRCYKICPEITPEQKLEAKRLMGQKRQKNARYRQRRKERLAQSNENPVAQRQNLQGAVTQGTETSNFQMNPDTHSFEVPHRPGMPSSVPLTDTRYAGAGYTAYRLTSSVTNNQDYSYQLEVTSREVSAGQHINEESTAARLSRILKGRRPHGLYTSFDVVDSTGLIRTE
ncbi:hypothetical protein B0H66DRAFT_636061 [Apodospora peruviana]|uniref:Uncharacterized protein n=1 Tax=Apodospora peruviana TaxID=516989 RepID=A0AAE0MG02_9PEZI|nr:hypothetical protein B0H66DRAFT_636061 [Apodospora peruviana]